MDKELSWDVYSYVFNEVKFSNKSFDDKIPVQIKGKSTLMIYDRHPELQSKWDKAFWARGYYVETIGNITDEAVQKYIKEQAEESRKEDSRSTAL